MSKALDRFDEVLADCLSAISESGYPSSYHGAIRTAALKLADEMVRESEEKIRRELNWALNPLTPPQEDK